MHRGVYRHLHIELQLLAARFGNGGTQYATTIAHHEVHFLGSYLFSGNYKIAFVLARLIVYNNHELSVPNALYGLFYGIQTASQLLRIAHISSFFGSNLLGLFSVVIVLPCFLQLACSLCFNLSCVTI